MENTSIRGLSCVPGAMCLLIGVGCSGRNASPFLEMSPANPPSSGSGSDVSASPDAAPGDAGGPDALSHFGLTVGPDSASDDVAVEAGASPSTESDAFVASAYLSDASIAGEGGWDGEPSGGGLDGSFVAADVANEAGPLLEYAFDTTTEGWSILATSGDKVSAASTVAWTGTLGNPTAGALVASIPFSAHKQSVEVGLRPKSQIDLTGKFITIQVYLASGLSNDPANPGAVAVFAQNGSSAPTPYAWVSGGWTTIGSANAQQWIPMTLDMTRVAAARPAFDPTQVATWGIQIDTGSTSATPAYFAAVVAIDTVTVR